MYVHAHGLKSIAHITSMYARTNLTWKDSEWEQRRLPLPPVLSLSPSHNLHSAHQPGTRWVEQPVCRWLTGSLLRPELNINNIIQVHGTICSESCSTGFCDVLVSFPNPISHARNSSGDVEVISWSSALSPDPIQTQGNSYSLLSLQNQELMSLYVSRLYLHEWQAGSENEPSGISLMNQYTRYVYTMHELNLCYMYALYLCNILFLLQLGINGKPNMGRLIWKMKSSRN